MRITKNQGFTLVELMIVIAIIGILASVAIPGYTNYVARGRLVEAGVNLASYRTSMEQYYQDIRMYASAVGSTVCGVPVPSAVGTTDNFTISCITSGVGATEGFTATATSRAGRGLGNAGAYVFTIDDANQKNTTRFEGVSVTAAVGTGCWLSRRGQRC